MPRFKSLFQHYKVQVSPCFRFPNCTITVHHWIDVRIKGVNNDKRKACPWTKAFQESQSLCQDGAAGPLFPLDYCLIAIGSDC